MTLGELQGGPFLKKIRAIWFSEDWKSQVRNHEGSLLRSIGRANVEAAQENLRNALLSKVLIASRKLHKIFTTRELSQVK